MTYQTNRPRRERKGDRLLNPDANKAQIECDYAIAPMDRLALEMDRKWGIDRLPEIVTPEMATRYGQAMAHMNECIRLGDPAKCVAAANNCIRGLHAMDAEATKLGKQPASGAYTEYDLDGWKIGILHDDAEWRTAEAARPDLQFFSLREAAIALKTKIDTPPIAAVKKAFPGARVVEHRTPLNTLLNDSIPFQRTDA
jgi:hypothetical protein